MTNKFTMAAAEVVLQVQGGEYLNLGGDLASFKPSIEATISEEEVYGREYPHYTMTGLTGGVEITGLRTGVNGDAIYSELHIEGHRDAFFAVFHTQAGMVGPCGYVKLASGDIMDADGVFRIDAQGAGYGQPGFEQFRHGTLLPSNLVGAAYEAGTNGTPVAAAEQAVVVDVAAMGGLTSIDVGLYKDNNFSHPYSFTVSERGLYAGVLENSSNQRTTETGTWHWYMIARGNQSGASFRVAAMHEFE